ncbi:hypothetical protein WJX79_002228 [Trebouxia sp. C0005]
MKVDDIFAPRTRYLLGQLKQYAYYNLESITVNQACIDEATQHEALRPTLKRPCPIWALADASCKQRRQTGSLSL